MTTGKSTMSLELKYLIGVILTNNPKTSGLDLSLAENQVTSVNDLIALPTVSIDSLKYFKDGKTEKVPGWAIQYLVQLKSFIKFQRLEGNTDSFSYTFEEYCMYLLDLYNPEYPHTAPVPTPELSATTSKFSIPLS